jgi:endo-1,4-beta-mannosidase
MNFARVDHIVGGSRWHSTFDPALYDPNKIDQVFQQMESDGYNLVRVFIDCCSAPGEQMGDPAGGLSSAYLGKVVDFLQRAKAHHIYVLMSVDLTPGEGGYNDPLWKAINDKVDGENVRYPTRGGLIVKTNYMTDFVQGLIDHQAPLEAVFAYDLTNEVHFDSAMPPLSLTSGLVTTVNGKTYDMAKPDDKDSMVNDNLIYWIDHLRESIRQLDPTALVVTSFFVPQTPITTRVGDTRFILTEAVIAQSQTDFIDLHPYPGWGLSLSQYASNFGITGSTQKPILMGEFGASTSTYVSAANAARALQNWQIESCRYGFDGWLLWTWDTEDTLGFWNALSQNHEIEEALAPINRPDPCQ